MPSPFDDICCARIPRNTLALLARLRVEPGLRAALTDEHAWLRWEAGNERVLEAVMPIHDVELFRLHDGRWHRFGASLPSFDFAGERDYQPFAHVLFPTAVQPIAAPTPVVAPIQLKLEPDDRPRTTTALLTSRQKLSSWSDTVPSARLASLLGVRLGDYVLVIGAPIPPVPGIQRYWGHDVLIPIGYAPVPALPESAIKEAAGVSEDGLLLWTPKHGTVIARALLKPLTRAAVRYGVV